MNIKCGIGFDAHRFEEGRRLVIGGIELPYEKGLKGHSDADVLIHAIIDSLAGPALCKDIGALFPDSDGSYKDIDSKVLLKRTGAMIAAEGFKISHIDAEIIAESPRMAPHIARMREAIADTLDISISEITIKATTTEKMGFTGRREGIAALASSVIIKG